MIQKIRLLPRDAALAPGRRLRFTFTVDYEVPLDEQLLDYVVPEDGGDVDLEAATLDDVERRIAPTSEAILAYLRENYNLVQVDHEVTLADVQWGADAPARFEQRWEQQERLEGTHAWQTREWLEEIPEPEPSPSAGASEPQQTKRVTRVQIDG